MPVFRSASDPLSTPYAALHTEAPLTIDGCLDKPAWQRANVIRSFTTFGARETPLSQTEARLLWDQEHLYVAYHALDKDVWSHLTQRDDPTCREDVLEIFFKTHPDQEPYFNFEINALGTVYDAFNPRLNFAGGSFRWCHWNCADLRVGVQVHGTLNDPRDVDEGWDLEMAIPFRSLPTLQGRPPAEGDVWAFHLARYDYSVYLPGEGKELTSCAPLSGKSFHDGSESWLRLRFQR